MIGKNNLQDVFFNKIRKEKISVVVFLINGVRLEGIVTWFDNFCILLKHKGKKQMIYKHAISTVEGIESFSLFEGSEDCDQFNNKLQK